MLIFELFDASGIVVSLQKAVAHIILITLACGNYLFSFNSYFYFAFEKTKESNTRPISWLLVVVKSEYESGNVDGEFSTLNHYAVVCNHGKLSFKAQNAHIN